MTDRQDVTRTRLLDATLGVLVSNGVSGATSRGIASAAGVNLQAITYHFGSKDELVAQALVHAVRRWVEPARAALAGVDEDPVGHLFAAVLALQSALDQARGYFPAYVEALAAAPRQETVRAEIVVLLHELSDGLALSIRELREAGLVARWVDPEAMAALVVAAGDGFVLHSMLDPDGYVVERTLGQVVQLLLAARTSSPVAFPPAAEAADPADAPADAPADDVPATAAPARPLAPRPKVVVRRSRIARPYPTRASAAGPAVTAGSEAAGSEEENRD
jgi:AcrR family transcriptional regulator